jgi:hypothetical protein
MSDSTPQPRRLQMRRNKAHKTHKICDRCGKTYWRSNRLRLWTTTNPGKRDGWAKDDVRLCTGCMAQSQARQAAHVVSARIVTIDMRQGHGHRKAS